jgi:hypothetical protein
MEKAFSRTPLSVSACLGRRPHHKHQASTKRDGRLISAEDGTESEALAALIKALDPEVEIVGDDRGQHLASLG